jgi:hypothetical protein
VPVAVGSLSSIVACDTKCVERLRLYVWAIYVLCHQGLVLSNADSHRLPVPADLETSNILHIKCFKVLISRVGKASIDPLYGHLSESSLFRLGTFIPKKDTNHLLFEYPCFLGFDISDFPGRNYV